MRKKFVGLLMASVFVLVTVLSVVSALASTPEPTAYELIDERTLRSKTYQLPSGEFEYHAFAADIHFENEKGKLEDIQNA